MFNDFRENHLRMQAVSENATKENDTLNISYFNSPVKTEDFTKEVEIALNDVFAGFVSVDNFNSVLVALSMNDIFKIIIVKLQGAN